MVIENYTGKEPQLIPLFIPNELWKPAWAEIEFLEARGALNSIETGPHCFEYQLEVEYICPTDFVRCKLHPINQFKFAAFLSQEPWALTEMHPYTTTLYLGTGSFLEDNIFTGSRIYFDMILLRKNTDLAKTLKVGDIIQCNATISNSECHGIQIIGKSLVKIGNNQNNASTSRDIFEKLEENTVAMKYNTMELA